jgi:hypothetical protein
MGAPQERDPVDTDSERPRERGRRVRVPTQQVPRRADEQVRIGADRRHGSEAGYDSRHCDERPAAHPATLTGCAGTDKPAKSLGAGPALSLRSRGRACGHHHYAIARVRARTASAGRRITIGESPDAFKRAKGRMSFVGKTEADAEPPDHVSLDRLVRLRTTMPDESPIDLDEHAAMIAYDVERQTHESTSGGHRDYPANTRKTFGASSRT